MSDSAVVVGGIPESAFVPNEADNTHCFQASYRMALTAQLACRLTKEEAERETDWMAGRPTWPYSGMRQMAERGLRLTSIEFLNIPDFVRDPRKALEKMIDDPDVLRDVVETTDLQHEAAAAAACLEHEKVTMIARGPTTADIREAVDAGGVVICNVNARVLDEREGYAPHFVLVTGTTDNEFVVQNPGLPAHPNQRVPHERFQAAWYFPDERMGNMLAVFKD